MKNNYRWKPSAAITREVFLLLHDDVIKWKHFPRNCPLCGEFTGPGEFPHKGQWRGALMFSLICAWIKGWVNNREAGDLRRHRGHYDVNVMWYTEMGSSLTETKWRHCLHRMFSFDNLRCSYCRNTLIYHIGFQLSQDLYWFPLQILLQWTHEYFIPTLRISMFVDLSRWVWGFVVGVGFGVDGLCISFPELSQQAESGTLQCKHNICIA